MSFLREKLAPKKEDSLLPAQFNQEFLEFHPLDKREVRGRFNGGAITSDAGRLLLREVEKRTGIIAQFAACFWDYRKAERIEHGVKERVAQRGGAATKRSVRSYFHNTPNSTKPLLKKQEFSAPG
jgi:hypothetical protein